MVRASEPILPATVVSTHLAASAAELAKCAESPQDFGNPEDVAKVITQVLEAQRAISRALGGLAVRMDAAKTTALAEAPSVEVEVLAEVLRAAAEAVHYSGEALAEAGPSFESVIATVSSNTRL